MKITFEELKSVGGDHYTYLVSEIFSFDIEGEKDIRKVEEKLKELFSSITFSSWCGKISFDFLDKADEAAFLLWSSDGIEWLSL
jgi:hypothetical protein